MNTIVLTGTVATVDHDEMTFTLLVADPDAIPHADRFKVCVDNVTRMPMGGEYVGVEGSASSSGKVYARRIMILGLESKL